MKRHSWKSPKPGDIWEWTGAYNENVLLLIEERPRPSWMVAASKMFYAISVSNGDTREWNFQEANMDRWVKRS